MKILIQKLYKFDLMEERICILEISLPYRVS